MFESLMALAGAAVAFAVAYPLKKKRKAPRFTALMMFLTGTGVAYALVRWGWAGFLAGFIPKAFLALVLVCAGIVGVIWFFIDMKDGKPDKQTQLIAFLLVPVLALTPGKVGNQVRGMVNGVHDQQINIVSDVTGVKIQ